MPSSVTVNRSSPLDLTHNPLFHRKSSVESTISKDMKMNDQHQYNPNQQLTHQNHQHFQGFHSSTQNDGFNKPSKNLGYRNYHQNLADDIDDDDDEDDDDDNEDDDNHGYQSTYHSAYNTAHNSPYNSCDESDDVNMEGVSLKEDHEMAEPPSTSNSSRFPYTPSQVFQPQNLHRPLNQNEPISSAPSTASFSVSHSNKSGQSIQTPLAIKPRPALRPLLPSRPTSPQPINLSRSNTQSTEMNGLKSNSSTPSINSKPTASVATTSSSSSTTAANSSGKTRQSAYKINGLNILNRNSLDSRTALEMIRRRRENHNHVERRRRDTLNSTILQIAEILPNCSSTAKLNKGTILRLALEHLRALHTENHSLRSENAALRFFYQGSQMRRNGPLQGSMGSSNNHNQSQPGSQNSQPFARGSMSSGVSTPPIIPGPGQGSIPSVNGTAAQYLQPAANSTMMATPSSTPGSTPGSAANSPPGQYLNYSRTSPAPPTSMPFGANTNPSIKRSQSTSGHLFPILPKSQTAKVSPSSSPRPRLLPNPNSNGMKQHNDTVRVGPSPLSSPCPSPPLAPMTLPHHNSSNQSALANALPNVPTSHHSAAVAAAAAAAAAAAGNGSNPNNSRSLMPSASNALTNRHHKSGSSGSQSSGHGSHTSYLPPVSSGSGAIPDKTRKFSAHSTHSSMGSNPSSGTPSATTSPYASPYQSSGHNQGGQGVPHTSSPSSHSNYHSSSPHHSQQYQPSHSQGSGITLPSIGSVTNPSSPMTSPHHGPYHMGSLALPTPMSLPAPAIGQDPFIKQHASMGQSANHSSGPHSHHTHAHSHEGLPILPPLAPR